MNNAGGNAKHINKIIHFELPPCDRDCKRSRWIEKAVLERKLRDKAAVSYRSKGLERAALERELRGEADGCTQRREGLDLSLEI